MVYIFDLDGTLVETYGEHPLPCVSEMLTQLLDQGHAIAVATNQAGPAWGIVTRDPKYPDPETLGRRFARVVSVLPQLAEAPWFAAVGDERLSLPSAAYRDLIQALCGGADGLELFASADPAWRKPAPGMLLAACRHLGAELDAATFIGDYDSDAEAAANAGMRFVFAERFFGSCPSNLS